MHCGVVFLLSHYYVAPLIVLWGIYNGWITAHIVKVLGYLGLGWLNGLGWHYE